VLETLKRHKVRQSAERLAAGPLWIDHDVVFANEVGGHLVDACVRRDVFAPLLKQAELPHMCPHDLRHTAATLLLEDGVNILTVSKMLGHSSVAFTLQLYGHVTAYMEQSASQAMERILFG
jgi:integrase